MSKIIKYTFGVTIINITWICSYIQYKSKSKSKLNIIFDMDDTILYSDKNQNWNQFNKKNILKPDVILEDRSIWIRPGVKLLLPLLAKFNNLYLFTKGTKSYANKLMDSSKLDKYFISKKYRSDCNGTCKDMNKFNLDLSESILIDDRITNNCDGQQIYHIPRFNLYVQNDYEFIKLFGYIVLANIYKDLASFKK